MRITINGMGGSLARAAIRGVLIWSIFLATGSLGSGITVSSTVEIAFSPDHGAAALIVKRVGQARRSIRIAAYSFTSKPIAQGLLEAHKRGIDIEVVVDQSQATARYMAATFLANEGVLGYAPMQGRHLGHIRRSAHRNGEARRQLRVVDGTEPFHSSGWLSSIIADEHSNMP